MSNVMFRPRPRGAIRLAVAAVALATATAVGAATAASATPSSSPAAPTTAPQLKVLTHNVEMLPAILTGDFQNSTRASLISNADYIKGYDVVGLQEAFDNTPSNSLKNGLLAEYPYQTPVIGRSTSGWDQTLGNFRYLSPEDGGVTILSKWPIVRKVQYIYPPGCGGDFFSNKGFAYVELNVNGTKVHVVSTHTQADDSICGIIDEAKVRDSQFAKIDSFLDGLNIPANEPVIVSGDLNAAREGSEYPEMLQALDADAPTVFDGAPFSFDPTTNGFTKKRYPNDSQSNLDYVLYRKGHGAPASWTNTVLAPKSPPWTAGGQTYTDYSDHYPVAGH